MKSHFPNLLTFRKKSAKQLSTMAFVSENRNISRISCVTLLFTASLCIISVCAIFVLKILNTSEKDTKFNTKYDKDEWAYLDDAILRENSRPKRAIPKPDIDSWEPWDTEEEMNNDSDEIFSSPWFIAGIIILAIGFLYWFWECVHICYVKKHRRLRTNQSELKSFYHRNNSGEERVATAV